MAGEQYAYTGSPHTAGEQYAGQRHATGVPIPPQTAGVSASASAARGYGALLNTHRHPHSTAQGHYMPTSRPVPPLPQHYAVGNSPRRLSNAPSDPSDKVHAGPIRAGPANNSHSSDDTSEDEIESLRRAMGSDSRAVQRQHLRREHTRSSDVPSSPATQGTSLSNAGMMSAAPGVAGLAQAVPGQGPVQGYTADILPSVQQKYTTAGMYAYPTTTMAPQAYTHAHYSHYPSRQYPQNYPPQPHPQQQHTQQFPSMAGAYAAVSTNPFAQSTMTGSSAAHVPPTVAHGTTDSVSHGAQAWAVSGYPTASSGVAESSARHESASVRSNDQMSGTVTDASGYSQAYWPHYNATYEHGLAISGAPAATAAAEPADGYLRTAHHQSPTLVHAQSPLRAATDSPMERKNGDAVPAAERELMQRVAGTVSANTHVTEAGTGASHGTGAAAGPQAHAERLPYSYSATALTPMREMQEHPQDIAPPMASTNASAAASASGMPAEAMTGPSPIAIQSLLNSPEDKVELMRFPSSEHGSVVSDGESAAIRKHIANENARYRRQSGASGQAPMQIPEPAQKIPLTYASRIPSDSIANNDSSPNSVSSYHSAGYSMWQGRAETIMDFATAQQSFSSADDALGPAQHRSSSFFTDAPVPDLPAPFTASSANAAEAMRAFEATVSSPEDAARPVDSSEPQSSAGYGYFKRRPKPVSVLVQVGDTHAESQVSSQQSAASSNDDTDSRQLPENPFASGKSARKATNESLENVLEYYRTHSEDASEPSPFELPSHPNRRVGQGLSLVSLDRVPSSPLYQRTSVSSPIDKPSSSKRTTSVSQWAARRTEATLDSSSSDDSMLPLTRGQSSPIAFDFARRAHGAIQTPCDSAVMGVDPWRPSDVYSMLDDLPEPDDLELPASAAIGTVGGQPMYPEITSDDHMLQMEELDGFDELSDIVDLSTAQDSDFEYSGSNDSTDSFGEPIEHEAGMLASRDRTLAPHSILHSEPARSAVARLADDFARAGMTAQQSDAAVDRALLSGRTNASTLTTSSAGNAEATVEATGDSTHTVPANGVREKPLVNDLPLEIMEIASELELALAREQEDYFTDNDPTQPTLDPTILQSLGRAVHQQCTLQRQQLQRRKSNMQLGLGTTDDTVVEEPVYTDHEQALRAMLSEVSQYFEQSGLSLVFPFAAKWVNWLTRHPDRPFPWRKEDPDDELRDDDASSESSFGGEPVLSRALPPDDVLSVAMIPMSKRRPARVTDIVTQEKRRGINAHWQYYSVINQIVTVASTIYHRLSVNDHTPVAHELAALYQFLGGDFKKYKARIETMFDAVKRSQQTDGGLGAHVEELQDTMSSIITDALYSANRVVPNKETTRVRAEPRAEPYSFAVATLKGLPTQPIVRYLTREMRVANSRRRGLATLSRNTSMGHMRHPIYQVPPVPPLPDVHSHKASDVGSKRSITSYE
ncbi:hypothetical protein GGH96_002964 [Coemansia sp. RSA 1972]|nr:hypothetical protein GGH96_002964 [Coemansia sp. RSA 1972]